MAYKVLQDHFPECVINHCILPYLIPTADQTKENLIELHLEFETLMLNSALYKFCTIGGGLESHEIVPYVLKRRYYRGFGQKV